MFRSLGLLVAIACVSNTASAAEPKIAVVDVEGVMNATDHWKKVVAMLTAERKTKQEQLEAKQKELKAKKDQLDAQKAVSNPASIAPQEEALLKDAQILTQSFMKTQQDLTEKEKKLTDEMFSRIEAVVHELASQESFDFVIDQGTAAVPNVLYAAKPLNITPRVIEQYNKRFKDKPLLATGTAP